MTPPPPPDYLATHAESIPDKIAVIDDRPDGTYTAWTFAGLNAQANRLANALAALGVARGERVVWCGQNSPGVVRTIHAARKLGAVAVPLNYRLTPEEAQYVVDDSDAVLACIDAEHAPLFEAIRDRIPKVREVLVHGGAPRPGQRALDPLVAAAGDAEPPPA
ncbi:MAG TPA: AMP-binding protein, partial [Burkholderiaceae bacterium]|nr:AMP-binding protein [Burkholderiaceae bacterium]